MTIRYLYNQQVMPPAPFVHVFVRPPQASQTAGPLPAQLDTAASRTVVPRRWIDTFVLLGRDMENRFRVLLDGPALAREIG